MMRGDLQRYAAANARVRALLAAMLGRSGLETLYSYPSRDAMLETLQRTAYGAAMPSEARSDAAVVGRLVQVGTIVLAMLNGPEHEVVRQYLLHYEIQNLTVIIRGLHGRWPWEHIKSHLVELQQLATVDQSALARARDLTELVERLNGTPYHQSLANAWRRLDEAGPFALEVALELDYYGRLWGATRALEASDRVWAQRLLGIVFDILNLDWIAYYHACGTRPEEISNYTLPWGRWITPPTGAALIDAIDEQWEAALAGTPYAAFFAGNAPHRSDLVFAGLWRVLAREIQHGLRIYPFHIGVPLGFLLAQEIEIRDLQVLLAAKGLGVATEEALEHVATLRP